MAVPCSATLAICLRARQAGRRQAGHALVRSALLMKIKAINVWLQYYLANHTAISKSQSQACRWWPHTTARSEIYKTLALVSAGLAIKLSYFHEELDILPIQVFYCQGLVVLISTALRTAS